MVLIAVLAVCLSANGQTNEYYYLRNVGTGKWLGPGNNVGVQASLTDVAYWVKFQNANNGYAVMKDEPLPAGNYWIQTQVYNNNKSQPHYLGTVDDRVGNYMDATAENAWTLTVTRLDNGYYTLSNANSSYVSAGNNNLIELVNNSNNAAEQWEIFSHSQMLEMLSTATETTSKDATFLIGDHSFGRNNVDHNKWTMDAANQNLSGGTIIINGPWMPPTRIFLVEPTAIAVQSLGIPISHSRKR